MTFQPHDFWQSFTPPGALDSDVALFSTSYPAPLADGRHLVLPLRVLPGDGQTAVASLILNQASFAVEDGLAAILANLLAPFEPEVIVGIPTLGLPLAANVARRLGHTRMVPLGTSRKFWYRDDLSQPLKSITTPGGGKTLYIDPRMLPLLRQQRVVLIDDVISSGQSMTAALHLLRKAEIEPVAIGCAMLQGEAWKTSFAAEQDKIVAPICSPLFSREGELWRPM